MAITTPTATQIMAAQEEARIAQAVVRTGIDPLVSAIQGGVIVPTAPAVMEGVSDLLCLITYKASDAATLQRGEGDTYLLRLEATGTTQEEEYVEGFCVFTLPAYTVDVFLRIW